MVNATDLFRETQALASEALKKNSAITTRVAERYNTTANRLKMLAMAGCRLSVFNDQVIGAEFQFIKRFQTADCLNFTQKIAYIILRRSDEGW